MPETTSETKVVPVRYDLPEDAHTKLGQFQRLFAAIEDKYFTQEQAIIHLIRTTELPRLKS